MSEKITDHLMLSIYKDIFKHYYHTEGNKELFNKKQPDGWDIIDDKYLLIFEDKRIEKYKNKGKKQLLNYYTNINQSVKNKYVTYLILGYGENDETFTYKIYQFDNNELINKKLTLNDLHKLINKTDEFDVKYIHELNKYMYDNGINLSKSQKTLFIASILICLKIDNNFTNDYNENTNSYNIANKMMKTIDEYYNDKIFTHMFEFITKSIHNKCLFHIFSVIKEYINIYGIDILNLFYSEFCIWDKNNDASLGVVLTPHDIVELMVDELHLTNNECVLDFCTGTGSFLMEASKHTKYLYGCENNDERYSLAKCNFILRDLDYTDLHYSSCFNICYKSSSFDKIIINPPFGSKCNNPDELNTNNIIGWKEFKKEQKFVIYGVELLKVNGIGCFIIPRSNLNNNKQNSAFKTVLLSTCQILKIYSLNSNVFVPNASVECSIIVLKRKADKLYTEQQTEIFDYSNDGYIINKKVRIKEREPIIKTQYKHLSSSNNWNYEKDMDENIDINKLIINYNNNYTHFYNNFKIVKNKCNELKIYNKIKQDDLIPFSKQINELIKEIKGIKKTIIKSTNNGIYPLISSTQYNNGVIKYIDTYTYNTNGKKVITLSRNGSVGYCYVHKGKLSITTDILIFEPLTNINIHLLALLMTNKLTKIFGYSNKITWDRIKDIVISL